MTDAKDAGERLWILASGLAESTAEASDQQLLDDARAVGRDAGTTQDRVRSLLSGAVLGFKKRRLEEAEGDRDRVLDAMHQPGKLRIPADGAGRRLLLGRIIQRQPQLHGTLQFREFERLTDEDVESMLTKLALLGALDEE